MPVVSKGGQTGIERIAANKLSRREDMALHGGVDVLPCRIFRKLEPRGVEREDHEPVVVPACVEERRTGAIVARARFARSWRAAAAVVVDANGAETRRRLPLLRKRTQCTKRRRGWETGISPEASRSARSVGTSSSRQASTKDAVPSGASVQESWGLRFVERTVEPSSPIRPQARASGMKSPCLKLSEVIFSGCFSTCGAARSGRRPLFISSLSAQDHSLEHWD